MDIVSSGPFHTGALVWLQHPETWTLTVIAKTTFRLQPNELAIADEQDPLCTDDVHWNDDRTRSLYAPSDFVPYKPRADVLLVGSAFAPRKEPVRSLLVRLSVGEIDKSIEVLGERTLMRDGQIREGFPFAKMPLRYERAAGGPGTTNPVGMRSELGLNQQTQLQLPNLQPPFMTTEEMEADPLLPIGFGPIAPSWPERRTILGAHASVFLSAEEWTEKPFPPEVSMEFFNAAPFDQQTDVLHEREHLLLENLHPDHPVLTTQLSGLRPRAVLERENGSTELIPMIADTLWIDTDRGVCTITWRGQAELSQRNEAGRVIVSVGKTPYASAPSLEPAAPSSRGIPASARAPQEILIDTAGGSEAERNTIPSAQPFPQTEMQKPSRGYSPPPPRASSFTNTDTPPPTLTRPTLMHDRAPPSTGALRRSESTSAFSSVSAPAPPRNSSDAGAAPIHTNTATSPSHRRPSTPFFSAATEPAPASAPGRAPPASQGRISSPFFPAIEAPVPAASKPATERSEGAAGDPPHEPARPHGPSTAVNRVPTFLKAPSKPAQPTKLIWFDTALASRLRAQRGLLSNADPSGDRSLITDALTHGEAAHPEELAQLVQDAALSDQGFEPPLSLVEGTLEFSFDDVEQLKASITVLRPLAAHDDELREVLDTATHLITASLTPNLGIVAFEHMGRIKEALSRSGRMLPADYLDSHVQRMLIEQRAYKRKTVFGRSWIRAEIQSSTAAVPAYLPDALAAELPMYRRFAARLLGEVDMREDEYESSPCLVRVCALARVTIIS